MRPKIVSWSENDSSSREACLLGGICVSEPLVNQVKSMTSLTRQQKRRLLNDVKEDARKHFENERNAVLESLPYSVKNHFFAVGYAKYENTHLPALVVDPFCVGPGSVRKSWLRRFKMRKTKGSLDKMEHLVFWYGERLENFSIVPVRHFKPWSVQNAQMYKLADKIEQRRQKDAPLTTRERRLVRSQEEMTADLKLTVDERAEGFQDFQDFEELHECLQEDDLAEFVRMSINTRQSKRKRRPQTSPSRHSKRNAPVAEEASLCVLSPTNHRESPSDNEDVSPDRIVSSCATTVAAPVSSSATASAASVSSATAMFSSAAASAAPVSSSATATAASVSSATAMSSCAAALAAPVSSSATAAAASVSSATAMSSSATASAASVSSATALSSSAAASAAPVSSSATASAASVSPDESSEQESFSSTDVNHEPSRPDTTESCPTASPLDVTSSSSNNDAAEYDGSSPGDDTKDQARFDFYLKRVQNLRMLNKSLRSEYDRLEIEIDSLRSRHQELVTMVMSISLQTTTDDDDDDVVEKVTSGDSSSLLHQQQQQLETAPSIPAVNDSYFVNMAVYFQTLEQNNRDLVKKNASTRTEATMLQEKIDSLSAQMEKSGIEVY